MERKSIRTALLVFYSLIVFGIGYVLGYEGWPLTELGLGSPNMPAAAAEVFDPFWETWNLVDEQYYDQPINPTQLTEGAIEGMLATLDDPNTRYLSPTLEETARQSMEGEVHGIGVLVEMVDGRITIVSPYEGSPAEEAGLEPGDIIVAADGQDLSEMELEEAAELIRGPAGTVVNLTIERNGEQFDVDVTRDVVEIPSVDGEMLEENVAYVRLNRFAIRTEEELRETLQRLMAQNPAGLILDLRNNPGGGLNSAVDVADEFLGEGVVLIEQFGSGNERVFESDEEGLAQEIPMVVLVNEGSASASEVLAGAIRDRDRGTLIGTTTFGKGTVQTWHPLSNGGGVRITTARWLTPEGTWVDEEGLTPDVVVEQPEPQEPVPDQPPQDEQLQAAVDYLLSDSVEAQE
jgi:carboxyl-terminal processing protease